MFWGPKKIIFLLNILATALKSYIKWLLYIFFFFLKKFEKVGKSGIISAKFSLRCTPSVILGCMANTCNLYFILRVSQFPLYIFAVQLIIAY